MQHPPLFSPAGLAQLVEQLTLNQLVRGSSPRSGTNSHLATLAQLVEHPPCKRTVVGSIPTGGSIAKIRVEAMQQWEAQLNYPSGMPNLS